MIEITRGVSISEHELAFSFDRSPGPGGQNVNKTSTRVTLHFDVGGSTSLSSVQKTRARQALATRIGRDGVLRVISSKERTQLANRRAAVNRFIELMAKAFDACKPRQKTQVPPSAQRKRLDGKNQRGALKRSRQAEFSLDD